MYLHPGKSALDLVGSHHFLVSNSGERVVIVAKDPHPRPVPSDPVPHFNRRPHPGPSRGCLILLVHGGTRGTTAAAHDPETVALVGGRAARQCHQCLRLVSGSSAFRASCAEGERPRTGKLSLCSPAPSRRQDGSMQNGILITRGGGFAGLDFGLTPGRRTRGMREARALDLVSDHDPAPRARSGRRRPQIRIRPP